MKQVSVIAPIYNEEGNVAQLHREICEVCEREGYEYEVIFVDDGSYDKTAQICKTLKPLKYIRMRSNFGQTAAMDAGIKASKYDYIITMDGDLQNDPADIPNLINYLEENDLDVVSGWRKNRKDTFLKKFTSRGANLLRKILVKDHIHDSGCSLKIYRKECFDHVNLYGEMHRFIPALLEMKGFKVGEIVVNHRARTSGKTKYNWKRTVKGFTDMISVWFWRRYSARPLHIFGTTGLVMMFMGFCFGVWSVVLFLQGRNMTDNSMPVLLCIFFILIGLMMFVFGLLCDIMIKVYYGSHIDTSYSIREVLIDGEKQELKTKRETII